MKIGKWILAHGLEFIAGLAFTTMLVAVFLNVLLRYFLQISLVWCNEVASICFIWSIFIGSAVCYKHKGLISVDVLVSMLPPKWKQLSAVVIDVFVMGTCLVLCVLSLQFSLSALGKLTLALRISYTFVDLAARSLLPPCVSMH